MLEHGYHIIVPILLTLVACVVMITTLNVGARYFCMILMVTGPFVGLNVSVEDCSLVFKCLLLTTIASNILGNNCCATTTDQEGCSDRYCQLCLVCLSLVHPVLFPSKPGAILSDGRWRNHCWVWFDSNLCPRYQVVLSEEEQRVG